MPFLGQDIEAKELVDGFQTILKMSWISAAKVSKDPTATSTVIHALQQHLEHALKLEPVEYSVLSVSRDDVPVTIPTYDMKELIQSAILRSGKFEKHLSLAFDAPLSQLIGSMWTYWTLLARIVSVPDPNKWNDIPKPLDLFFQDILERAYATSRSTWGYIIMSEQDQKQLASYQDFIRQKLQDTTTCADLSEASLVGNAQDGLERPEQDEARTDHHRHTRTEEYRERLERLSPIDQDMYERELQERSMMPYS